MRCYVEPGSWSDGEIELPAEEARHLRTVLRARLGQHIGLFDGCGRTAEAEVTLLDRHAARARILQQQQHPRAGVELVLIQGVPREQKMDVVIQKAVELGVSRILPLAADHAVMQVRGDNEEAKQERWRRIALNAGKQSGAAWLPVMDPVRDMGGCLAALGPSVGLLIGSLEPDARPFRETLQALRPSAPSALGVLIGPEGDFSAREYAAARNAGARPVNLGPRVLRSETAALFMLSALVYEFS